MNGVTGEGRVAISDGIMQMMLRLSQLLRTECDLGSTRFGLKMTGSVTSKVIEADELATLALREDGLVKREPPRPLASRAADYDALFDYLTIFYDAFFTSDPCHIKLVGPPLLGLEDLMADVKIRVICEEDSAAAEVVGFDYNRVKKVACYDVRLDRTARAIRLEFSLGIAGVFTIPVNNSCVSLFEGRRVVFTLFKFEPLAWIRDWVEYNVKYHGADGFLIYHNSSTLYTTKEIRAGLAGIDGVEQLVVVHWPFPYGPGDDGSGVWDSNFCQLGMFEHARRRFLERAEGVLNTDIDELVITDGHRSIFDMLAASAPGYIRIHGHWISDGSDVEHSRAVDLRRHRDFSHIGGHVKGDISAPKWAVRPQACQDTSQWRVHSISDIAPDTVARKRAFFGHFYGINVKWKHENLPPLVNQQPHEPVIEAFRLVGWV